MIRNTWLSVSKKNHNFKALFVMGNRNLNSKEEYEIATEKSRYDDILLLPIFDSYGTLTNKVSTRKRANIDICDIHLLTTQVLRSIVFVQKHHRFTFCVIFSLFFSFYSLGQFGLCFHFILSTLWLNLSLVQQRLLLTFAPSSRFDFLLKCDDDTFVDIEKVIEELQVPSTTYIKTKHGPTI